MIVKKANNDWKVRNIREKEKNRIDSILWISILEILSSQFLFYIFSLVFYRLQNLTTPLCFYFKLTKGALLCLFFEILFLYLSRILVKLPSNWCPSNIIKGWRGEIIIKMHRYFRKEKKEIMIIQYRNSVGTIPWLPEYIVKLLL